MTRNSMDSQARFEQLLTDTQARGFEVNAWRHRNGDLLSFIVPGSDPNGAVRFYVIQHFYARDRYSVVFDGQALVGDFALDEVADMMLALGTPSGSAVNS